MGTSGRFVALVVVMVTTTGFRFSQSSSCTLPSFCCDQEDRLRKVVAEIEALFREVQKTLK
jgi:hypothetical protein